MKLMESIMTKNPCYTAGRRITVRGLMLHSVGCPQPSAEAFIRNWNCPDFKSACVHAFIDGNDGAVYQTLPWDHRGWHCGASGNNTHIGVEMCEPACIRYTGGSTFTCSDLTAARAVARTTYQAAVELFAMLCRKFSLDPLGDGVILSHREGHTRGIASNHGDPEHLWNQLGLPYTMDSFRADVKAAVGGGAAPAVVPFRVRVTATDLNIRIGPGTSYSKTGKFTGAGVFTITEIKNGPGSAKGWGRLKSDAGWIALDYAQRI